MNGSRDSPSISDDRVHSLVHISRFLRLSSGHSSATIACSNAQVDTSADISSHLWSDLRRVVDKVHRHTCGLASFSDTRSFLQRNDMWSDDVQSYLADVIERCTPCIVSSALPPSRKVALGATNRSFSDVVLIDHFYHDQLRLSTPWTVIIGTKQSTLYPTHRKIQLRSRLKLHGSPSFGTISYYQVVPNVQ